MRRALFVVLACATSAAVAKYGGLIEDDGSTLPSWLPSAMFVGMLLYHLYSNMKRDDAEGAERRRHEAAIEDLSQNMKELKERMTQHAAIVKLVGEYLDGEIGTEDFFEKADPLLRPKFVFRPPSDWRSGGAARGST